MTKILELLTDLALPEDIAEQLETIIISSTLEKVIPTSYLIDIFKTLIIEDIYFLRD